MIVTRFYDTTLAQASYLIGCSRSGTAIVVDPNRDVEQYVRAADAGGLRITHVTETHIHADYVSGVRELAARTGATPYLSDEGDADWKYGYAAEAGAVLIRGGESFMVGNVRLDVVHTPGHTPEHVSFLVTDTAVADLPIAIVTGDFVFVGDVGRPDLLERAAKFEGTMERSARTLFASLQGFKAYPDWLQIWPGHGAGSACGKGLSAVPHSTVGYERRFNWALQIADEDTFVEAVLAGQPEPPRYFAEMKRINKAGPTLLHGVRRPERLPAARIEGLLRAGTMVIDARHAADFAAAHVPGTLNIPLGASFTTWAGWLMPYDRDFAVIVDDQCPHCIDEAVRDLAMIGLDRIAGYFASEVVRAWSAGGREPGRVPQIGAVDLATRMRAGGITVIDVRGRAEWDAGHIRGALNIPLGYLVDRLGQLPRETPVVLQCRSGARSAIATSLLQAHGLSNVVNLSGGLVAWEREGYPLEAFMEPGRHAMMVG
jgi:hydroxyacylglutathione hydrolase